MKYDERNRMTLNELAPATKKAALKWYQVVLTLGIDILIYDARRTEAEQKDNVRRGVSKTMKSYHLVGQAFDFVPLDKNGKPVWTQAAYYTSDIQVLIMCAKYIGFESGTDWKKKGEKYGWDCPHMEYRYKGYGTDK